MTKNKVYDHERSGEFDAVACRSPEMTSVSVQEGGGGEPHR